jgi:hypothetical protein
MVTDRCAAFARQVLFPATLRAVSTRDSAAGHSTVRGKVCALDLHWFQKRVVGARRGQAKPQCVLRPVEHIHPRSCS